MKKIYKCTLFLGGFIVGIGLSALAQADLYRVSNVPIFAEQNTVAQARRMALANGQVDAFWVLMRKMTEPNELVKIPLLGPEEVVNFVQNVSIADEKTTVTRYRATLSVRFNPQKIQDLLTEYRVPFLMQGPPVYLVIPVFKSGDAVSILTDDNPVYAFFKNRKNDTGLFELIIPAGGEDENAFITDRVISGAETGWDELLTKYGAERVIFVELTQTGPVLTLQTRAVPADREALETLSNQVMIPDGMVESALPKLWQKQTNALEQVWRKAKTNDLTSPNIFWVQVPIESLKEWQSIEADLRQADFLNRVDVRAYRPRQVLVALHYKGAGDQLKRELNQIGFTVRAVVGQVAQELTRGTSDEVEPEKEQVYQEGES